MTLIRSSPSSASANEDCCRAGGTTLPRFILRKRTVSKGDDEGELTKPLPTVTSAFLSGLFADVAQVSVDTAKKSSSEQDETNAQAASDEMEGTRPVKKSRLSLHRSMSRCARSYKNLSGLMSSAAGFATSSSVSPTGVADPILSFTNQEAPLIPDLTKHDSLHFQLCALSSTSYSNHRPNHYDSDDDNEEANAASLFISSQNQDPHQTVFQAGELAFPHLPATVSNSSYSNNNGTLPSNYCSLTSNNSRTNLHLTRNVSDLQSSVRENTNTSPNSKEPAYGWFVVVDPDSDEATLGARKVSSATLDPYSTHSSTTDLAFLAPTAPLATNQDDEVEWAKAADMVDDVLGDFF